MSEGDQIKHRLLKLLGAVLVLQPWTQQLNANAFQDSACLSVLLVTQLEIWLLSECYSAAELTTVHVYAIPCSPLISFLTGR